MVVNNNYNNENSHHNYTTINCDYVSAFKKYVTNCFLFIILFEFLIAFHLYESYL